MLTNVEDAIAEGNIGDLELESSSVQASGFSVEEEDSNLGIILGVSIPAAILLIAAIIACIVKKKGGNADQGSYEENRYSEDNMSKNHRYL